MIPQTKTNLLDLEIEEETSKSYALHTQSRTIGGYCDGSEAMEQVIYMILNTERYQYPVYSWDYGVELLDLFGEPIDYVCAELERRISEALTQDDRINDVTDFEFDISKKGVVNVSFIVKTVFGNLESGKAVNY